MGFCYGNQTLIHCCLLFLYFILRIMDHRHHQRRREFIWILILVFHRGISVGSAIWLNYLHWESDKLYEQFVRNEITSDAIIVNFFLLLSYIENCMPLIFQIFIRIHYTHTRTPVNWRRCSGVDEKIKRKWTAYTYSRRRYHIM